MHATILRRVHPKALSLDLAGTLQAEIRWQVWQEPRARGRYLASQARFRCSHSARAVLSPVIGIERFKARNRVIVANILDAISLAASEAPNARMQVSSHCSI